MIIASNVQLAVCHCPPIICITLHLCGESGLDLGQNCRQARFRVRLAQYVYCAIDCSYLGGLVTTLMKKALRETQTLRARCSNVEPKIFAPLQTPFPGAQDGQNLISWR